MRLVTSEIDETDPRYIDYLKTTDNPTWIGYQNYCGDLFDAETNVKLKKYTDRNNKFLEESGYGEIFGWAQEYIKGLTGWRSRAAIGDAVFDAELRLEGNYNPLMMFLFPADELDKEEIIARLEHLSEQRKIIENEKQKV